MWYFVSLNDSLTIFCVMGVNVIGRQEVSYTFECIVLQFSLFLAIVIVIYMH